MNENLLQKKIQKAINRIEPKKIDHARLDRLIDKEIKKSIRSNESFS